MKAGRLTWGPSHQAPGLFDALHQVVPRVVAPRGMSPRDQLQWVFQHVAWLRDGSER